MERLVELPNLIFLLIFAAVAFILRLIIGVLKGEEGRAVLVALETAAITFLGGFIARMFISLLLAAGEDGTDVGLLIGWGFFFPVGVIDTIITLITGNAVLTRPEVILWIAAAVGAFSGMMAGIWRIYDWHALGVPAFVLDSTWGLSGTTIGCLLHLVNFAWGDHADESFDRRRNNHRYKKGFALKSGFAFTQGAVMSNLSGDSSTKLWHHENTHVWQNRIFGPFFTLTYVGWMAVMLIPSLIVGAAHSATVGEAIMALCYYNNPWEVWAYKIGGYRSPTLAWGDVAVIVASVLFYLPFLALSGAVVAGAYSG